MTHILDSVMQDEESRQAFGEHLKALRKNNLRWTQKEVAAKIGLQLSQFNKYGCGMHVPPADKPIPLAELLGTTTDYLLTGTVSDARPINPVHMLERFRVLSQCETEEQETVIRLIDAVIVKRCVESARVSVDAAA